MKKIILLALILLLSVSISSAQTDPKPFNIYGSVGLAFSNGPALFQDMHKVGYDLYAGVGFKSLPLVQLIGKVEMINQKKDWAFLSNVGISGGDVNMWLFGVDAKVDLGAPVMPIKPFIIVGGGFAKINVDDITVAPTITLQVPSGVEDGTKFYYNIGVGVNFGTGPLNFYAQARYVKIKQDGDNVTLIPINIGIKF